MTSTLNPTEDDKFLALYFLVYKYSLMTVLIAENESNLKFGQCFWQCMLKEKTKVYVNKNEVIVCGWSRNEVVDFWMPDRRLKFKKKCKIILNGE